MNMKMSTIGAAMVLVMAIASRNTGAEQIQVKSGASGSFVSFGETSGEESGTIITP
ncbi:MAG: hypothetical protein HYZ72_05115 [Deltaproteobacteria bacterium]|nr:hypothetical protein [Deltaproteobacteria bacterium]